MVNRHGLGRHLTSFFILNKDLLLKNRRLTIVGLKVINIKVIQVGKSFSFYTTNIFIIYL